MRPLSYLTYLKVIRSLDAQCQYQWEHTVGHHWTFCPDKAWMCCKTVHINLLLLGTENFWDMTLGLLSMTYFLGFLNICPKGIVFSSAFWTHVFFIWGSYYFYCGNVLILLKGESSKNCKPNIIPLIQQVRTIFNQQWWIKCLTI